MQVSGYKLQVASLQNRSQEPNLYLVSRESYLAEKKSEDKTVLSIEYIVYSEERKR